MAEILFLIIPCDLTDPFKSDLLPPKNECDPQKGTMLKGDFILQPAFFRSKL